MPTIELLITEPPIPQARPRFLRYVAKVCDPCAKAKRNTQVLLMQQMQSVRNSQPNILLPIGKTPIEIYVNFFIKSPGAAPKAEYGKPSIRNGDVDNYLKYILDCLQPDIIENDCCVWKAVSCKIQCNNPRTEVTLKW